jgi:hypothetical protein
MDFASFLVTVTLLAACIQSLEWHEQKPNSFIVACDRFIYIEVLDGAIKKKKPRGVSYTDTKKVLTRP